MEAIRRQIQSHAVSLRMTHLKKNVDSTIHQAQIDKPTYQQYTLDLLGREVKHRRETDYQRRLKMAGLPGSHNLDTYDFNFSNGVNKHELKQLRELAWLEQNYNVVLMGPSGTGKTFIASGLIFDAIKQGYKAYFLTMEELVQIIRLKEVTSTALGKYNRLLKSHLIAIDDIMMFPMKRHESVALLFCAVIFGNFYN